MNEQPDVFEPEDPTPDAREAELIDEAERETETEAAAESVAEEADLGDRFDLSLPDDTSAAAALDRLRARIVKNVDTMSMSDVVRVYVTMGRIEEARLLAEAKKKPPVSTDLVALRKAARAAMTAAGGRGDDDD